MVAIPVNMFGSLLRFDVQPISSNIPYLCFRFGLSFLIVLQSFACLLPPAAVGFLLLAWLIWPDLVSMKRQIVNSNIQRRANQIQPNRAHTFDTVFVLVRLSYIIQTVGHTNQSTRVSMDLNPMLYKCLCFSLCFFLCASTDCIAQHETRSLM